MNRTVRDPTYDAGAALLGQVLSDDLRSIKSAIQRLTQFVRCLEKFSFPLVAQSLAGLLTIPENHGATGRFEMLIHLVALGCRGNQAPTRRHLQEWLNDVVLQDPITEFEGPVEDVYISNVVTWFGNVRMLEGRWEGNSYYVQTCIAALLRVADRPWAVEALTHVEALLRLSEAVSERAQVARYSLKAYQPRQPVTIDASTVTQSAYHVSFDRDELDQIGVAAAALDPFVFQEQHKELIASESLGHTALERRPIVQFEGRTIVVLPTAIGAAIRRFAIERAVAADELKLFQSACHQDQFREIFLSGLPAWDIEYKRFLEHDPDQDLREFIGTFDDGGYVHLVFVPDDFEEIANVGLFGVQSFKGMLVNRLRECATCLATQPDYRLGLTIVVHGGIGRNFTEDFGGFPHNWHCLCLSAPDFILLGNEAEFTAKRAWKLLQQVADLEHRGVFFPTLRGFLNLVAFGFHNDFELVPINMSLSPIYLHNDFIAPFRHRICTALDRHGTLAPDGQSWIPVQHETTSSLFGQTRIRPLLVVPRHITEKEFLVCVETARGAWWMRCSEMPESEWHRSIVFMILNMVARWLCRLAPLLEESLQGLPSGPITYCLRFSDIEMVTQHLVSLAELASSPVVSVEGRQAIIDCTPYYLANFLSAENSGDRLMIEALVRAIHAFSGVPMPGDEAIAECVQAVVGSDDARFFRITPGHTPHDVIYDATSLPDPRFLQPEDFAWARLDLARRSGYDSPPGPIPESRVGVLLEKAVDSVWARVRSRLTKLSRESVIEQSLRNFMATQKDRRDWYRSADAKLALFDRVEVLQVTIRRDTQRDVASLACRVIAEMALCTSPYQDGVACTGIDLDFLIAEVATLLECAAQSDASRYGLVARPPIIYANGSFGFEASIEHTIGPLQAAYGNRVFREAVAAHRYEFEPRDEDKLEDGSFESSFIAEFGLHREQYARFVFRITEEAVEQHVPHLRLRRSKVVEHLREVGVAVPERVFEGFALTPRARWDEAQPRNAKAKDWYPWRFNRRLSILRRPLVQFSMESDPEVLVMPSLLAGTLDYLSEAARGCLPGNLFDSPEMISYIGRAAERNGHAFNRKVAKRLDSLRWITRQELSLTKLSGNAALGDIDVLAWRKSSGLVYAVECKSLRFDRTYGEIGERLSEYVVDTVGRSRTDLQKHLDRISYLKSNPEQVAKFTGIPIGRLQLRSALVTEKLVAMQFFGPAQDMLDLVADFDSLHEVFG